MIRLYLSIAALAAVFGAYLWVLDAQSAKRERDALQGEIETREDIDNALACSPDLPWHERLLACE